MNKINPKTIKIIMGIPPKLNKNDRCALDSEWYHMQDGKLHRPTGTFACSTFTIDGKTVYVVTDPKDINKRILIDADALSDSFKEQFECDLKYYKVDRLSMCNFRKKNNKFYTKIAKQIFIKELNKRLQ